MFEKTIELCKKLELWSVDDYTGDPASDEEIALAENELGFSLCRHYISYLKELGWLDVAGAAYLGLISGEGRQNAASDFVAATLEFTKRFPSPRNLTVLFNESDEWFELVDHDSSLVICYDPFSKEFVSTGKDLVEYFNGCILDFIKAREELEDL